MNANAEAVEAAKEATFTNMLAEAWAAGYDKGTDLAAWAIGNRPHSERPDTSNPYRSQA